MPKFRENSKQRFARLIVETIETLSEKTAAEIRAEKAGKPLTGKQKKKARSDARWYGGPNDTLKDPMYLALTAREERKNKAAQIRAAKERAKKKEK